MDEIPLLKREIVKKKNKPSLKAHFIQDLVEIISIFHICRGNYSFSFIIIDLMITLNVLISFS